MSVIDVNENNFVREVLESSIPVIIDIWAEWCVPCIQYSPVIEEVAKDYEGRIKFVKINADQNEKIMERLDIMSMPTTLLIERGQVAAMNVGAIPKDALKKWISKNDTLRVNK